MRAADFQRGIAYASFCPLLINKTTFASLLHVQCLQLPSNIGRHVVNVRVVEVDRHRERGLSSGGLFHNKLSKGTLFPCCGPVCSNQHHLHTQHQ